MVRQTRSIVNDLTADRIIAVHADIIARNGGDGRIASEANLLQVVFQANLIGMVVSRAAYVFFALVAYPVFREGNAKTAEDIALLILAEESYGIGADDQDSLGRLAEGILAFTAEPEDVEAWFAIHAKRSS